VKDIHAKEYRFETDYAAYSQHVFRLCLGYVGNAAEAEDLLQEIFVKVWQNYDQFRGDSQVGTWIYRIAVNTCLYKIRSSKSSLMQTIKDNVEDVSENYSEKEQQTQLLYKCIEQLPDSERLIITMVLEDISYPEIAKITDITEANLRVKIHRIKQKLTDLYNRYERF
jgi:RNA polymerase sigma-70 factor (ECF subfamily)